MNSTPTPEKKKKSGLRYELEHRFELVLFFSRWFQAPLYLGLVLVQIIFCYFFLKELWHFTLQAQVFTETAIILGILALLDAVMISNLVVVVIIGGYTTFVSQINVDDEDRPGWLDHIDAGSIKVKLSSSLIGISSIHLLQSFFNISSCKPEEVYFQIWIHLTILLSTLCLALTEFVMGRRHPPGHDAH